MEVFEVPSSERLILSATTKGNQPKWFYNNLYLKADFLGYEGLAEAFSSTVESLVVNRNFQYVDYNMCKIREFQEDVGVFIDYPGCYSENMLLNDESIIPLSRILEKVYGEIEAKKLMETHGESTLNKVVSTVEFVTGIKECVFRSYLSNILKLDAIILNEDRHYANISLAKSSSGTYRLLPVFDNGLSLLSDTHQYRHNLPIRTLIRMVKAKPFNVSFKKQIGYFKEESPLLIKDAKFISEMVADLYDIGDNTLAFHRAKSVLRIRMESMKGVAWEDA